MELYKDTINTVEFEAPNSTVNVTAEYTLNGGSVTQIVPVKSTTENTIWNITLPYLSEEGTVKITWKFTIAGTEYRKDDFYKVVTPYVSTRWIKQNLMEDSTTEEIRQVEAAVRHIINAHTGQSFGKTKETKTIYGDGSSALSLPARLLAVETINGIALPTAYQINGDGWWLAHPNYGIPPLKADYYGLHEVHGVIENPYGVKANRFAEGAKFEIAGTWGWETVPEAVTEAAKLLVNDYGSGDSMYRDRYLVSMTAADWRIQFNRGAFSKTGNVRADQLLGDYVLKRGWAVI